ncbi:ESX secretion-associated protein EspG [Rhodococcus tukisamuensis]|uniref:EspG family protein n=1 Tax=Rhodococcus tukisamuensis TaxID=168276 RepID=A0A1G6M7M9_9NOCA|nr:ESX secretion-associated protein EspG [Rhodococcus tukisamuensis]SDC50986.1 EspG family protein [Rhodococcus tukisamuensis]
MIETPAVLTSGAVLGPAGLPSATLTLDELGLLVHLLRIDELPVALDASSRFDTAAARDAAFVGAARTLTGRGLLDHGDPHPDLADRLRTLARPDREVALRRYTGDGDGGRLCVALGPLGGVVAHCEENSVVLQPCSVPIRDLLCGTAGFARPLMFEPVNAVTAGLVEALSDCADPAATARKLATLGVAAREAGVLAAALATCFARTEIVAMRRADGRSAPLGAPVAVIDTDHGRILGTSSTATDGTAWSTLGPGGDARVRQAVGALVGEV